MMQLWGCLCTHLVGWASVGSCSPREPGPVLLAGVSWWLPVADTLSPCSVAQGRSEGWAGAWPGCNCCLGPPWGLFWVSGDSQVSGPVGHTFEDRLDLPTSLSSYLSGPFQAYVLRAIHLADSASPVGHTLCFQPYRGLLV